MKLRLAAVGFALSILSGCGVRTLPAPPKPAVVAHAVQDPPPTAEGATRVVVDADGADATVELIVSKVSHLHGHVVGTRRLCSRTPCATSLPPGSYELVIRRNDDPTQLGEVSVDVGTHTTVVRHHLPERTDPGALRTVGAGLALLGVIGASIGGTFALVDSASDSDSNRGPAILAVSGAAIAVGLLGVIIDRPTFRPGSTTQYYAAEEVAGAPPNRVLSRRRVPGPHVAVTPFGIMGSF